MKKLVRAIGQSAHLVIVDQGKALYLNKVESPGAFIAQLSKIGLRFPMHCTAVDEVLLSYMESAETVKIIKDNSLKNDS